MRLYWSAEARSLDVVVVTRLEEDAIGLAVVGTAPNGRRADPYEGGLGRRHDDRLAVLEVELEGRRSDTGKPAQDRRLVRTVAVEVLAFREWVPGLPRRA